MSAAIVGGRASSRLHILFFLLPLGITSQQGLIVQTDIGPVIGRQMVAANGLMVFTFQGIPYAQPPVGNERWKPAKPAHNWSEPYANATLPYKGRCAQSRDFVQIGSEDCLYLSIFTPSIEQGAQLPIIVWIHDQRSESGISGDTPETGFRDNLAARGIIAITFNY
uniref:Carboxylesterase type B domain-containing protein n=1 Tax=Plectus sambesii TaxID=2011161 RepID=A0A914X5V9_9BILA